MAPRFAVFGALNQLKQEVWMCSTSCCSGRNQCEPITVGEASTNRGGGRRDISSRLGACAGHEQSGLCSRASLRTERWTNIRNSTRVRSKKRSRGDFLAAPDNRDRGRATAGPITSAYRVAARRPAALGPWAEVDFPAVFSRIAHSLAPPIERCLFIETMRIEKLLVAAAQV